MSKPAKTGHLRKAAEVRLKAVSVTRSASAARSDAELRRTLHELQVHQIELEMQNHELHEARAEREAALARYTELYDFAPVGYLTLDTGGLIKEINLTGASLLRVARRNLHQMRLDSFVVQADRPHWANFFASVKTHAGQDNVELEMCRGDGTIFFAQMDCVRHKVGAGGMALRADESCLEVCIALTDISVRKRVEARLSEAMAAAEKATRAKTDFLSSMSHELRTPLNAILGFAQIMESSTPPPTASQQRDLTRILKAGWYLLELINEVLDLTLIESGKAMLSYEAVALNEVMLECQALIEPQAQQRGIELRLPLDGVFRYVMADRTRLKQVLINLLFNAVKYNNPGGVVSIECILRPSGSIRINVRDTGGGLTQEQLGQLFQPFNRLGKEAGGEEGTGIGLVVTKRLVELMGGVIGVDSSIGVGSLFWIEFPLVSPPAGALPHAGPVESARAPAPDASPAGTLLYVEDDPANLDLVEQLIARCPELRLLSAADGKLGIEYARAYQPQVILMDINLPGGISGLEVMQSLRTDPLTAHIPIIALSANALPRDVEKGLAAGFARYLTKPIRIAEFMDTLDAALKFVAASPGPEIRK
jgi:signal transduction histidine kinase/CheY-like chemotaxis protein